MICCAEVDICLNLRLVAAAKPLVGDQTRLVVLHSSSLLSAAKDAHTIEQQANMT